MASLVVFILLAQVEWQHPAGIITDGAVEEVRAKLDAHDWAKRTYQNQQNQVQPWLEVSSEKLRESFPRRTGNVYHNFSCPKDRHRLTFDPFNPSRFTCPSCGAEYDPSTDAGIYQPSNRYHGTMHDGWACIFYQTAAFMAARMGLLGRIEDDPAYFDRGVELLMLYTDAIEGIKTVDDPDPQMRRIFTYHREGESKVLYDAARAYELLRHHMTDEQRERFERVFLERMLNDVMLEPIYTYNHNNLYRWHLSLLYTAMALERENLIDWCFGYGDFTPEKQPDHSSIRKLAATHFLPDGAFWGLNSGYHLYPLHSFCETAVFSHHLSQTDPKRFPPEKYDLTDRNSFGGDTIHRALHWFMSMAMPDRTMPTLGDSPAPRAGMDDYFTTAEVGYRFYDLKAVGDYERYRNGQRTWAGLLYGAPEIVQHEMPFTSTYLSSGWVSLRNEWKGNRVWVGLNALKKGSGHQHADRLNFVHYSHGQLLSIEKATPYNESVTRVLGTRSQAHNTVTVDKTSQKQGEVLTEEEEPEVRFFHAGPIAQFAELHGDRIYPNTSVYRRSVAVVEDVIIDCFRVEGGDTHDWMVNHAGPAPELSVPMTEGTFDPADWLANGTDHVLTATTDDTWQATWHVENVTSRLTMLGAPATTLYQLETYPIANAKITENDPPCQTLCVRRSGSSNVSARQDDARQNDGTFLAVWDAYTDAPNLQDIQPGDTPGSLRIRTAANTYHILFGPGKATFTDGATLETDGAFALVRKSDTAFPSGGALLVGGTALVLDTPNGNLRLIADTPTTASAELRDGEAANGVVATTTFNAIHYDTFGGEDHEREAPKANVAANDGLWRSGT